MLYLYELIITDVPAMVPGVTVDNVIIGHNVTITLIWEKPFNNFDPIVNFTVSCSGDDTCPPNFTTADNTTRSYTITNLTPMTNYTFSVVATNSIGSGEAGVVMITTPMSSVSVNTISSTSLSSSITTTAAPSVSTTTTATLNANTTATASNLDMTEGITITGRF